MDEIGAEVSQKIRSAIKAKLMELGAYVDEELPDYIMVMVANRRSREQMEDDLQLFLGSNTEEFTGWLHQVLQKLQEVTVASLERKRKASTGDSEGENIKKEKRRKSSERKKVRRGGEQTREKDTKDNSENVNQHSGKLKELENLTKSHLEQNVPSSEVNSTITNEYIGKLEVRSGREQQDKVVSLSHNLDTTKSGDMQVSSVSELSHIMRKDSGKIHGDQENFKSSQKSDETYSGKPGYRKIILGGKTNASNKISHSSMEESCNLHKSSSPLKKGIGSGNVTDIIRHNDVRSREKTTATTAVHLQPVSRPKIVMMQSDDDDDEDFINIKADAEAEELLDAELPKETPQETNHSSVKLNTAALCNNKDAVVTSAAKDEENLSSVQCCQLSHRLGAKVTSGSVLDRLGVKKVMHESNSPLLRITDRLSDKVISPVSDRLGGRKVRCDDIRDSDRSSNRKSISVLSQPERCSISVAQVAPTAAKTVSRVMNADTETEQFGPKTMQGLLNEEETAGKDQVPRKRLLLSRVVAMHREAEEEEEEEYDPANPAVGSVASVVRVKPRPKVPAALQANKNLILKAMAEAQKSVANAPKRVEPHERLDGLYTRKFRDDKGSNKIAITLPNRRMQPHKVCPVTEKPSDIERIVIPVKLETSRSISSVNLQQKIVIQVSSHKPAAQDTISPPDIMHSNMPEENVAANISSDFEEGSKKLMEVAAVVGREEANEVQSAVAYESESPWSKDQAELVSRPDVSRTESPQFVVTLDGLDPSVFEVHSRKKQQTYSVILNSPNMDSESSAVEYKEKEVTRSEEVKRQKRAASPILYQKSESSDTGSATDTLKQKINERCKYWPACRSGDKCMYLHPTVPCKSFPNCKFGDKCLYIHPNCKFDASCTRRDCPFTHASPRNMSGATATVARVVGSAGRATQQVCRFFPKCSNVNCRFLHPKPCRYGRYCSKKTECSFLHEDIPPADKLRWFCPFRL